MKYEKIKEQDIVSTFPAVDAVVCNLVLNQVLGLADDPENTPLQRYRTICLLIGSLRDLEHQSKAEALAYLRTNHLYAFEPIDFNTEWRHIARTLTNNKQEGTYKLVDGCKIKAYTFAEFKKLRRKDEILNAKVAISDKVYAQFETLLKDIAQRTKTLMSKKENAKVKPSLVLDHICFEGDIQGVETLI